MSYKCGYVCPKCSVVSTVADFKVSRPCQGCGKFSDINTVANVAVKETWDPGRWPWQWFRINTEYSDMNGGREDA